MLTILPPADVAAAQDCGTSGLVFEWKEVARIPCISRLTSNLGHPFVLADNYRAPIVASLPSENGAATPIRAIKDGRKMISVERVFSDHSARRLQLARAIAMNISQPPLKIEGSCDVMCADIGRDRSGLTGNFSF